MNQPTDPLELLQRLRVSVLTRQLPDSVALWLQFAIDDYLTGSGTLDCCLGLKASPGKRAFSSTLRLADRDELIRRAARQMAGSIWQQAGVMVEALRDFEDLTAAGINWRDPKARLLIPKSLGGSGGFRLEYIAEMHRCEMDIPASRAQLYRILCGERS